AWTFAFEVQVVKTTSEVEIARPALQVQTQPVVELECKNIRRGADLQHQVAGAGAVDGGVGDEEQVVRVGGERLHKVFDSHGRAGGCAVFERTAEGGRINVVAEAQVGARAWRVVE